MKSTIILFFFLTNFLYGQTSSAFEKISGTYKCGSTKSFELILLLNDNKTFKFLTQSETFGNSKYKGNWKTSADTLLLFSNKKISAKYIISADSLIELRIANTEDGLSNLKRQKK